MSAHEDAPAPSQMARSVIGMVAHFGVPFHAALQREVVTKALQLVLAAEASGTIVTLPIKWADVRREVRMLTEQGKSLLTFTAHAPVNRRTISAVTASARAAICSAVWSWIGCGT